MTKPKATPGDVRGKGEHGYIADGLRHLAVPPKMMEYVAREVCRQWLGVRP